MTTIYQRLKDAGVDVFADDIMLVNPDYPDNDPKHLNRNSSDFVKEVVQKIKDGKIDIPSHFKGQMNKRTAKY